MVSQYSSTVMTSSSSDASAVYQTSSITQYGGPPATKRHRWESGGSDNEMPYAGEFHLLSFLFVLSLLIVLRNLFQDLCFLSFFLLSHLFFSHISVCLVLFLFLLPLDFSCPLSLFFHLSHFFSLFPSFIFLFLILNFYFLFSFPHLLTMHFSSPLFSCHHSNINNTFCIFFPPLLLI